MPNAYQLLIALCLCTALGLASGCSSTKPGDEFEGVPVYDPSDPKVALGPNVKQSEFKVYWLYKPQVQRQDFNGVFTISQREIRLVSSFWNRRFTQLTRKDFYTDFFSEFYDYMSNVAQAYPADTRQKEYILNRLEKHFQLFCANKGVESDYLKHKENIQRIFGE